jgi:hypothetical protein
MSQPTRRNLPSGQVPDTRAGRRRSFDTRDIFRLAIVERQRSRHLRQTTTIAAEV